MATRSKKTHNRKKTDTDQSAASKNKGGAPVGNINAFKGRCWSDAIRRAAARAAKGPKGEGNYAMVNKLADALVRKAAKGNVQALKEFGDRIEGKVPQTIQGNGPEGEIVTTVTIKVV